MFKYFSANNTRKYVHVLDLLVDQYNNTIHSSIKMTPKSLNVVLLISLIVFSVEAETITHYYILDYKLFIYKIVENVRFGNV